MKIFELKQIPYFLVCYKFNATNDFNVEKYLFKEHNETINYCG
jgi:hypothetical protein